MIKKTLCEHCVFKTMTNGVQTGCQLDRVNKLPHHLESPFIVIDSYCSTCRNIYWEQAQGVKTNDELIQTVMAEVKLQYDVILVCEPEDSQESIRKTLDSIKAKTYKPMRVITTTQMTDFNRDMIRVLAAEYDSRFTFMMSSETEISLRLRPPVEKAKSAFLLFTYPGKDYDESIIAEFDRAMNIEMKPKFLSASDSFYLCPKFLYVQFMNEELPFEEMNKYVHAVATASQRPNS